MLAFACYILKVIVCSIVLHGYYWFFLRNKVFHNYNRFYLLATVILSLGMPLMKFDVWQQEIKNALMNYLGKSINSATPG